MSPADTFTTLMSHAPGCATARARCSARGAARSAFGVDPGDDEDDVYNLPHTDIDRGLGEQNAR